MTVDPSGRTVDATSGHCAAGWSVRRESHLPPNRYAKRSVSASTTPTCAA